MNEKKLYHNALEEELLRGKNLKARLDAKLSGERDAAHVYERKPEAAESGRLPKWIGIPAAAVLLLLTVALGTLVIARGLKNPQRPGGQPIAKSATPAPIETVSDAPEDLPVTPKPEDLPVTPEPTVLPTPGQTFPPEPTPTSGTTEVPAMIPTPSPGGTETPAMRPTPTATPVPEYLPVPPESVRFDDDALLTLYRTASDETEIEITLDITCTEGASEAEKRAGVLAEQARLESFGYLLDVSADSTAYRVITTVGALRSFPASLSYRYHFGLIAVAAPSASVIPETEDTVDICIWFRDDFSGETALSDLQKENPELYQAYRNGGPDDRLQSAIERMRQIAEAHYTAENRKKLASVCDENAVLVLCRYAPMCIVRVQKDRLEAIGSDPNVARIKPFENRTSTGS